MSGYLYQTKIKREDSFHASISPVDWEDFSPMFLFYIFFGIFGFLVFWHIRKPLLGLLLAAIQLLSLILLLLHHKRSWQTIQVDGDDLVIATQSVVGTARTRALKLKDIEAVVHEPRFVAIYIKVRGKRWIRGLATFNIPPAEKKLLAEELAGYLGVPLMRKGIWSTRFYPRELGKRQKEE